MLIGQSYIPAIVGNKIDSWGNPIGTEGVFYDRHPIVQPEPIVTDVDCLQFTQTYSGYVELFGAFSPLDGQKWVVEFTIPDTYEQVGSIDIFIGTPTGRAIVMNDTSIGFWVANTEYKLWDGTFGTTSVAPASNESATYRFYCDGASIHLSVDGVSKGFVTPSNTELYAVTYANDFASKLANVGGWVLPPNYGGEELTPATATFYHPLQEGYGEWVGDISGHNIHGAIKTTDTSWCRGKTDNIKSICMLLGTNHSSVISTNLIINGDFRLGSFGWIGNGNSYATDGLAHLLYDAIDPSYVIQGIDFIDGNKYRFRYKVREGSLGIAIIGGCVRLSDGLDAVLSPSAGWHEIDVVSDGTYPDLVLFIALGGCNIVLEEIEMFDLGEGDTHIPPFTEPMKSIRYEETLLDTDLTNDDNDWNLVGGATIANNEVSMVPNSYFYQNIQTGYLQTGKVYFLYLTFSATIDTGDLSLLTDGFGGILQTLGRNGTDTSYAIICIKDDAPLVIFSSGWTGTVTNISLLPIDEIYLPSPEGSLTDIFGGDLNMKPNYVHNGCGVSLQQHPDATELLDKVIVSLDGVEYDFIYDGVDGFGDQKYANGPQGNIYINSDHWFLVGPNGPSTNPVVANRYPTKDHWPNNAGGQTVSVSYESNWIDDEGRLIRRDFDNFKSSVGGINNEIIQWRNGQVFEDMMYKQGTFDDITIEEYESMIKYTKDNISGMIEPLYDVNGELVYDDNGSLIFVMPEEI